MEQVTWSAALPVAICTVFVQAASGLTYIWMVWRRLRAREITKLMLLSFFATTPMVLAAGLLALIGRQSGDVLIAATCATMWIGQLPFMFGGLPALESLLAEERRLEEKAAGLNRVRDGQA